MILSKFTVLQLMIAAGISRRLDRSEICRITSCTQGYITKLLNNQAFNDLVKMFGMLPSDNDTKVYRGAGTIIMEVGRLVYSQGEKL
jgi:hypothetical protein